MIRLLHEAKCRIALLTGDTMDYSSLKTFCGGVLRCKFNLRHFSLEPELSDQGRGDDVDQVFNLYHRTHKEAVILKVHLDSRNRRKW